MKKILFILFVFVSSFSFGQGMKALLMGQGAAQYNIVLIDSVDVTGTQSLPDFPHLNSTGTKLYVTDGNDLTYQYSMSPAYDLSTASYDSKSMDPSQSPSEPPNGSGFGSSTKFYFSNRFANDIFQYTLSTADDISTASYDSKSFNLGYNNLDISIYNTGDNYVINDVDASLFRTYSMSTSYDISTSSAGTTYSYPVAGAGRFCFNEDGTRFYTVSGISDIMYVYFLSTAYVISSNQLIASLDWNLAGHQAVGIFAVGDYIYMVDNVADYIYQFELQLQ